LLPYQFWKNWERGLFWKQVTPAHNTDHYFRSECWLENMSMDTFSQSVVIDADTIVSHDEALVVWLAHQRFMHKGVYNVSDETKIGQKFSK